jgi:DNA-binding NarL/FixJ family response regulator
VSAATAHDSRNESRDGIRVLVVDDHDIFRSGLRSLLTEHGFDVAADAADAETALELLEDLLPDVILMDIHMPGIGGVEATRRITISAPLARVVVLTISAEERDVADAIMAGASGYVLKDAPLEQLIDAIEAAAAGDAFISPSIAMQLLRRVRAGTGAGDLARSVESQLSERELEILKLIAAGKDNAEIGRQLFLSTKTVKNLVTSILRKLQLQNRIEAAVLAVRSGIA